MGQSTHLALVTGAAKRIGRAIVMRLAAEGCDIAIHYNTSKQEADAVVAEVAALGRRAHAIAFDQSDGAAIAGGMAQIRESFGRAPDVLVNSASIFEWDSIATVEAASLSRHYATNVVGPVLLARAVADAATDSTRGLILNLLDTKLTNPNPDHLSYTLSKYALDGFTHLMARALAPRFRVCAIAPGHTLPGPGESDEHFAAVHDETPLGRGSTPEDIANAAAFLLASPAITGQTLIVDGGAFMRPAGRDTAFQ
jgi:NAD(P)-dependent dehydrogenase (short-subunit alcohol dehydrogenase family)